MTVKTESSLTRSRDRSVCPLFASALDDMPVCQADPEALESIRPLYAATICRKARHFTCPRFVAAAPAVKRAAMLGTLDAGASSSGEVEAPVESPPARSGTMRPAARRVVDSAPPQRRATTPVAEPAADTREGPRPAAAAVTADVPAAPITPSPPPSIALGAAPATQDAKPVLPIEPPAAIVAKPAAPVFPEPTGGEGENRERRRPPIPVWWLLLAAASILGFAVVVELHRSAVLVPHVAAPRPPVRSTRPVRPLVAPVGLMERQVGARRALFSWLPVPRATSYLVRVGKYRYTTRVTHVVVDHPFRPGSHHNWDVRGRRGSRPGRVSSTAMFSVEPLPSTVWSFSLVRMPNVVWFLTLYNPNSFAAQAVIGNANGSSSGAIRVRIPAYATAEVRVPTVKAKSFTIVVHGTAPLLGQQLGIGSRARHPVFGIPGN